MAGDVVGELLETVALGANQRRWMGHPPSDGLLALLDVLTDAYASRDSGQATRHDGCMDASRNGQAGPLTRRAAAEAAGVTCSTVDRWRRAGLPSAKDRAGRVTIEAADLEAFLDG